MVVNLISENVFVTDIPVNHGFGYDSKTSTWLWTVGSFGGRSDPQLVRPERLHGCQ
jgi:hypothetical protein